MRWPGASNRGTEQAERMGDMNTMGAATIEWIARILQLFSLDFKILVRGLVKYVFRNWLRPLKHG